MAKWLVTVMLLAPLLPVVLVWLLRLCWWQFHQLLPLLVLCGLYQQQVSSFQVWCLQDWMTALLLGSCQLVNSRCILLL
jgi:hypothetical protein